jgi:hypothetical protein
MRSKPVPCVLTQASLSSRLLSLAHKRRFKSSIWSLAAAFLLLAGIYIEVQTSVLQSRIFTHLNERVSFTLGPGLSPSIALPGSGPFDDRRGYSKLAAYQSRLEAAGYRITQQAQQSETLASLISHGRENDLFIEIDGTLGALQWRQEEPNKMVVRRNGEPHRLYTRDPNAPFTNDAGRAASRLPAGHPEAFFEAFANVYRAAFDDMVRRAAGESFDRRDTIYPNVHDGVEGMYFIQQCVASSAEGGAWLPLKHLRARK